MSHTILHLLSVTLLFVAPSSFQTEDLTKDLSGYRIAALVITGTTSFSRELLMADFPIKTGDIANWPQIKKGIEHIRQRHAEAGYIDFAYTQQIDINEKTKTISCSFHISQGSQYTVRQINLVGHSLLRDQDIRSTFSNLGLEEGRTFHLSRLNEAIKALNKLLGEEKLSSNDFKWTKSDKAAGTVDITIQLQSNTR